MTKASAAYAPGFSAIDLTILDDIFPHQYSGFRLAEYRGYLEHFARAIVHSTGKGLAIMRDERELEEVVEEFETAYPNLTQKVVKYTKNHDLKTKIIYFIFLTHYRTFAETINRARAPFVFTLYPGGGFQLYEDFSNRLLRECFANPFFRKVIVTQPITQEYLLKNKFVSEEQTILIPGVVVPDEFLLQPCEDKLIFGQHKSTIDIAFIAHRYTSLGGQKGYGTFIEVAHRLSKHKIKPKFHVIGGFDHRDIDVSKLNDSITFHGAVGTAEFIDICKGIDLVISPNVPGLSDTGIFDGFPTGSAVQAGLRGAAVFCTDELMQNRTFVNKQDLVIIPSDARRIAECVASYLDNVDELYRLALTGRQTFIAQYGRDAQLTPRIKVLEGLLEAAG
jgi:glycosyltransferase involved in cell wall biosynthesis